MLKLNFMRSENAIFIMTFAWLITAYHFIFHNYFPLPNGHMGHDYAYVLPALIDNYFWFMNNGIFSPPWFSPAFCGGQVNFADPQSMYYSIPQFFLFVGFNLIQSIYFSIILFASIGFIGMYLLARERFKLSFYSALICGAIFMYNGFYIYRMIVGHVTVQGFMLVPLITYLLLSPSRLSINPLTWMSSVGAGLLLAYWYLSGMVIIIIPCIFSILAIILIYLIYIKNSSLLIIFNKTLIASVVGLCLSASKLTGSITLMELFPRTQYQLPGFADFITILKVFFNSLFYSSHYSAEKAVDLWMNNTLSRPPHELAFGITIIPLIIISLRLLQHILYRTKHKIRLALDIKVADLFYLLALLIITSMPFLLNYYNPEWNDFLKKIPIISATTSPQRWMIIYILIITIYSGIAQNSIKYLQFFIFLISIIAIPLLLSIEKKDYYNTQPYEAITIEKEFRGFIASENKPKILNNIMVGPALNTRQNSYLIEGADGLNCYNPIYGYYLENIPFTSLMLGAVLGEVSPNVLNIRNPSCILYPKENHCKLWDNFSTQNIKEADAFVSYKPFKFERSYIQHVSDLISTTSVVAILLFLVLCLYLSLKNQSIAHKANHKKGRRSSPNTDKHH